MELKGTRTHANLMAAFAGEAQACTKYYYYANKARHDGYEEIASIFEKTVVNETAHAKIWFKLLHDGGIPDTFANLGDAANGEHYEWTDMYKNFAEEAKKEGFDKISYLFEQVGKIEKDHEERFKTFYNQIENNTVFKKDKEESWICINCGHIHHGHDALKMCPVCAHPQAFFAIQSGNN